jgi:hypothetical protein
MGDRGDDGSGFEMVKLLVNPSPGDGSGLLVLAIRLAMGRFESGVGISETLALLAREFDLA